MNINNDEEVSQDYREPFLLCSIADHPRCFNTCPYATTTTAYSDHFNSLVLIALTCKRWGCRYCGQRKAVDLGFRVQLANPNKLITLTVNPRAYQRPRAAYEDTRRKLSDFSKLVRKNIGEFEYIRILEVTKKGWPHYHLVARSGYIPQRMISSIWSDLTGAKIVDIRAIKKVEHVYSYVMKYLCKQTYIPWTNRRVSWSRHFFPAKEPTQKGKWKLHCKKWIDEHPSTVIHSDYLGSVCIKIAADAWLLDKPGGILSREEDSTAADRSPRKFPEFDLGGAPLNP